MMDSLYFSGSARLGQKPLAGIGSILMLHRVERSGSRVFSPNSHLSVAPEFLEKVLKFLTAGRYDLVSMDEVAHRLGNAKDGPTKRPFIAVTLDDGYRDNLENAVPLFRKYNVPFTIYVAPGLVDGKASLWWENLEQIIAKLDTIHLDMPQGRAEFPLRSHSEKNRAFEKLIAYFTRQTTEAEQRRIIKDLCWMHKVDAASHLRQSIMSWKELSQLAEDPLCTLGAHTMGHYAVARLDEEEAIYEMEQSKRVVEAETGRPVKHFAYPYGYPAAAGIRDFALAQKAGYMTAVTTRHGVCYQQHKDHLMALPRISLNGNFQKLRYVKTLLSGAPTRLANKGSALNVS